MEGQGLLQRTHHRYEDDPHHHHSAVMEGEGEHNHHGEKKSVLTKVKNKAKKIKDKIKHAGHTYEDDDEYDFDEDEETVNPSHDVHAAPMNEPTFISGTALPKQTGLSLDNPTNLPSARDEVFDLPKQTDHGLGNDPTNLPSARDEPVYDDVGNFRAADSKMPPNIGGDPVTKPSHLANDPYIHRIHKTEHSGARDVGVGLGKVARPVEHSGVRDVGVGLGKVARPVEDPNSGVGLGKVGRPVEDPNQKTEYSGARDVGVGLRPVEDPNSGVGLGKVGRPVEDPNQKTEYSGARDVGVGLRPVEDPNSGVGLGKVARPVEDPPLANNGSKQRANVAEPMVKISPLGDLDEDPHCPKTYPGAIPPPNYETKVADPTGQGGEEVDVDPLLRRLDNMHVDDVHHKPKTESEERAYTGSHDQFAPEPMISTSEQFNPMSFDAERPEYMPRDQFAPEPMISTTEQFNPKSFDAEWPESMPEDQFAPEPMIPTSDEQLSPKTFDAERPESMPQDTIAGKISAATSAITSKASSAKDMVASKLGYGGSQIQEGDVQERPQKSTLESVSEYGHRVAEQLAPVYEKAAGAGSAITSKVQRSGGGGGGGGGEGGGVVNQESDKGVSVQNYFVEKFSPGEEDRELSKVITDAIGRKGGDQRGEEAVPVAEKETIRVEAVASNEKAAAGVVDRVKGAVGSWLGKNRGQQGVGEGLEKEITSKLQE